MHIAIQKHAGIYPDPIIVESGDLMELSGKTDDWEGHTWIWAKARDRREGWVPDDLPVEHGRQIRADYVYSAKELDVEAGEKVKVSEQRHGWAWCQNDSGNAGWVPMKVLQPC